MNLETRIKAFATLGLFLKNCGKGMGLQHEHERALVAFNALVETTSQLTQYNGWFVKEFVFNALQSLGESLDEKKLRKWVSTYKKELKPVANPKTVGVLMAGNVPAVGFHDFLTVLMSGNKILIKLSSDDNKLMPALAKLLEAIEPSFENLIEFTDGFLKGFDAIIATGSNNTARYFEYYFGKYPNIIRKNRNGIAVINGKESRVELEAFADDIFLYYGLGCRNVAKLFVPEAYDFHPLLEVLAKNEKIVQNHKYFNNYEYNKAIYLVNGKRHFDTGNLLLTEEESFASPVSVLHYEYYHSATKLRSKLLFNTDKIQCVVSGSKVVENVIPFGKSQQPELWDYADGVDTMRFLTGLLRS